MAEIKVRITGDNADFQKKLQESTAESRKAAAEMKEQFAELGKRAGDVAGETGLGRIGSALKDLSSGAVLAFSTALVGAFTEGVKKASEFTDAVTRIGIQLGNLQRGKEMGEYIEKISLVGAGPSKEQLLSGANAMLSAGMKEEEVRTWLPRIQRLSAATGIGADQWSEMISGGSVGITRGLEHSPLVRGAMAATGRTDPMEALAWAADTTYANALTIMSSTPSGKFEAIKRKTGNIFEQLGASFLDPSLDPLNYYGRGGVNEGTARLIYQSGPNAGTSIITGPGKDLQDAARSLKESADKQEKVWRKFGDMWDVR